MKVFHCFLGLFFLISVSVSQSIASEDIVPSDLQNAIDSVKKMKRAGASNKSIAAFVTNAVINRLTFLNHFSNRMSPDTKLEKKLKIFNAWRDKGDMVDDTFSSAIWAWENRMGQCNESASTAFHILAMAYESTDEITTVTKGDHRFAILGDIKNMPATFSPDELRKLDDTYIVDPWDGVSFSTKDLSFVDWYQHGESRQVARTKYRFYKYQYNEWLTWCKNNPVKYQKWLHGISDADAEENVEHKDSMDFVLAQYRKEIDELTVIKEQILQNGKASKSKIESILWDARIIRGELEKYETLILTLVDQGQLLCDEARTFHQKIIDLSIAMEDGEALVNSKIDLAKGRAANCKTDEDSDFIKNNYQSAKDASAIMKTAKEGAFEILVDINIKLEQIKKIDTELSPHDSNAWKKEKRRHGEIINEIPQYLDQLETGLKKAKAFPSKVQALKKKIEDSKQHYIQYFPGAKTEFDSLINEVGSIELYYVTSIAGLDDLAQDYQSAQTVLDRPIGNNSRLFSGAPPLINCFSDKLSKSVMDKINEAYFRALLVLKNNAHLQDGCKEKVTEQVPSDESDQPPQPPAVDTDESTPSVDSVATDGQADPSNTMGGLIISGPAEITIGQGVTYTACDSKGIPYTAGSFSWNYSDQLILSLGNKSGNSVSGVANKPGNVLLWVRYNGETVYKAKAYLDIKIKDKKNNLFGSSGGETKKAPDSTQNAEENKLKKQCRQMEVEIKSALDSGNTERAERLTNTAFGMGCTVNSLLLAKVEDIEKKKKEKKEQEKAEIAQEKERFEGECRELRLGIISAVGKKNVAALKNLAIRANNSKCNVNISYIYQTIAQIEGEREHAQKKAEQQAKNNQQTIEAVQGIFNLFTQAMTNQPSKPKPSRPSSPTNNQSSFPTQTYNGMDPNVMSSVPGAGSNSSINTGQPQNNSKYSGSLCRGHHLVCSYGQYDFKNAVNDFNKDKVCDICGRPYKYVSSMKVFDKKRNPPCVDYYSKLDGPQCKGHVLSCNQGYGRNSRMTIDRSPRDRICDICGRSFKNSGNNVRGVITKKNVQCTEVKK